MLAGKVSDESVQQGLGLPPGWKEVEICFTGEMVNVNLSANLRFVLYPKCVLTKNIPPDGNNDDLCFYKKLTVNNIQNKINSFLLFIDITTLGNQTSCGLPKV